MVYIYTRITPQFFWSLSCRSYYPRWLLVYHWLNAYTVNKCTFNHSIIIIIIKWCARCETTPCRVYRCPYRLQVRTYYTDGDEIDCNDLELISFLHSDKYILKLFYTLYHIPITLCPRATSIKISHCRFPFYIPTYIYIRLHNYICTRMLYYTIIIITDV